MDEFIEPRETEFLKYLAPYLNLQDREWWQGPMSEHDHWTASWALKDYIRRKKSTNY